MLIMFLEDRRAFQFRKHGRHSARCIVYKEVFKFPRTAYKKNLLYTGVESTLLGWHVLLPERIYNSHYGNGVVDMFGY